jgi:replicative DNA helicase
MSTPESVMIGGLMRNPDEIADVRDIVAVDDLVQDPLRRVYSTLLSMHERKIPISLVSVSHALAQAGELVDVGDELLALLYSDATPGNVQYYAQCVASNSLKRNIRYAAIETLGEADDEKPIGPPEEILERAQGRFDRLAQRLAGTDAVWITDALDREFDQIDARAKGRAVLGTPTGFAEVDEVLCGGLAKSQMTTLAARPSVGKTSLSMNVVRNVCEAGGSVLFVSLEQPEGELIDRFLASVSGVAGNRIRQGRMRGTDADKVRDAGDLIRRWRLQINDRPGQTAGQIAARARRAKRKAKGLDLIVVDYLHMVEPDNRKATRNEQVGAVARRLRDMARELQVPLLLCCQLNRDAAGDNVVPRLSHLRDSGEIEQVSDVVLILHRTGRDPDGSDLIDLHVAKQRNGPLATIGFEHRTPVYTFVERGIDP